MQLDAEETIKVCKFLATEVETLTLGKLISVCFKNKAALTAQRGPCLFDRGKTDFEYITDLRNSMIHYGRPSFPPMLEKYERDKLTRRYAAVLKHHIFNIVYSKNFVQKVC